MGTYGHYICAWVGTPKKFGGDTSGEMDLDSSGVGGTGTPFWARKRGAVDSNVGSREEGVREKSPKYLFPGLILGIVLGIGNTKQKGLAVMLNP